MKTSGISFNKLLHTHTHTHTEGLLDENSFFLPCGKSDKKTLFGSSQHQVYSWSKVQKEGWILKGPLYFFTGFYLKRERGKKEEKETCSREERSHFEAALLSQHQKDEGRQVSFLSSRLLCPRFHLGRTIVARRWFKRLMAEMIFRNLLAFSSVIASLYDTEERSFWGEKSFVPASSS